MTESHGTDAIHLLILYEISGSQFWRIADVVKCIINSVWDDAVMFIGSSVPTMFEYDVLFAELVSQYQW